MASLPAANGTADAVVVTIDGHSTARTVFIGCLLLEIGFVLFDYHVNYGRLTEIGALRRLANIAREDGLASWFATSQTLLVGMTAWGFWVGVRARRAELWRQAGWLLVAMLFTYMAVDDGAQLHERFGAAYAAFREQGASRFPSFAWQPLFVPLFGTVGAAAGIFLWRELRSRWATSLVVAAFLLFGIAVGLDFLEGLESDHPWNLYAAAVTSYDMTHFTETRFSQMPYDTLVHFSRSLEEFVEMLANTCIWTAMLGRAGAVIQHVRFQAKPVR